MIQFKDQATSKAGKFLLGKLVATPGAISAMAKSAQDPAVLLARHRNSDWGEVSPDDGLANDQAIQSEDRILSAYFLPDRTKVWVITECDRSVTTILLPEEY